MNSAPEFFTPSKSPATDPKPPPAFPVKAASMAIPEFDWPSGGINCVVDSYLFGMRNASRVPASKPLAAARPRAVRASHNNRSRCTKAPRFCGRGALRGGASPEPGYGGASGQNLD